MANTKTSKETTKPSNDAKKVEKLEAQLKEQKEQIDALMAMLNSAIVPLVLLSILIKIYEKRKSIDFLFLFSKIVEICFSTCYNYFINI